MSDPAQKPLTVDEFLAWDDGTDRRYELSAGAISSTTLDKGINSCYGRPICCRGERAG